MEDEQYEAMLLAVFDHYDLPEPPWGERAMRCPVHDDTHPSCSVNRGKGLFFCHACGATGNAAHIVMAREGLDYAEAMRFIEAMGVDTRDRPPLTRGPSKRKGGRWMPPRLRESA